MKTNTTTANNKLSTTFPKGTTIKSFSPVIIKEESKKEKEYKVSFVPSDTVLVENKNGEFLLGVKKKSLKKEHLGFPLLSERDVVVLIKNCINEPLNSINNTNLKYDVLKLIVESIESKMEKKFEKEIKRLNIINKNNKKRFSHNFLRLKTIKHLVSYSFFFFCVILSLFFVVFYFV